MKINLVIFGPPGSGKGTYASRLQRELGLPAIATGDMFRELVRRRTELGKDVHQYMKDGELVPDNIVISVLKKRMEKGDCQKGFILDGYPRTMKQAESLEKCKAVDAIIHLLVPEQIIVNRLSSRRICQNCGEVYNIRFLKPQREGICDKCGGRLHQRIDDTIKVIKDRLKVYEQRTQPLIKYYRERVPFVEFSCESVDIPPEVAVADIMKGLQNIRLST